MRRLLILRGTFAVVLGILAVVAFSSGEDIFGALLVAFAITNVILICVFTWHRARTAGRPPVPPARRPN
jgi:hypothetical protein